MCNLYPDEIAQRFSRLAAVVVAVSRSLGFFHTLVDTHNSMLSGNCSVNATIITFNAPIKKQRERERESGLREGKRGGGTTGKRS